MKIINYFSMPWKVSAAMSASIQCQSYKIGSIMTLFPNFIWTLLQHNKPNAKKGTRAQKEMYHTWRARAESLP